MKPANQNQASDPFKRRMMLAIIALAEVGTLCAWAIMARRQVPGIEVGIWGTTTAYLAGLFVVTWRRWLSQLVVDLACLVFMAGLCGAWMALCLYSPRYSAPIYIEPLYLWILVIHVFAFALAGHRISLAVSLVVFALFLGISLPYLVQHTGARYANFTIQLHVVSAVLIAALYFFSSYQHRLRLAQVTVEQLAELSNTDDLTRLPNRRRMAAVISAGLARVTAAGPAFAVMLIDIDQFKTINDRYGHAAGDEALVALASRAREVLRGGDTIGRWGGDEFVVVLPGMGAEAAAGKADALCRHVAAQALAAGQPFTISCGAAVATPGDDCDSLLRRADRALYAAKQNGRNRAEAAAHAGDVAAMQRG